MPESSAPGLNPLALAFTVCMGILILVLPRRYALLPMFAAACYMTMGQSVKVAGLNFGILRILTLVGGIRLGMRGEFRGIRLNGIDKAIICWTISAVTIYTILWGTPEAFIYQCGHAYDAISLYVFFRALVRNIPDITRVFRSLAVLLAPLAAFMMLEKMTGRNVFGVFGGVPGITLVRDGVLRCQGPFPHSILAGTFGAALVPFFVALWYQGGSSRRFALAGLASSTVITLTAGSSGPFMTYTSAAIGLASWRWRFQMHIVRRGVVVALIGLQMIMSQPVWFIIAHLGVFSASTSYYRAYLIDRTIVHFSEWWLIGTKYQQPWGPLLTDITDMYVRVAMDGGLLTLVLFFMILKRCFAGVGRAIRAKVHRPLPTQYYIWALGAALFAHTITFLAVWYWDQNIVSWYLLLAIIATVTTPAYAIRKQEPATRTAVEDMPDPTPEPA